VSVNGGAFVAVPGTSFTSNGYNGTVGPGSSSALNGQQGWVGTSPGYTNGFLTSVAVLGNFNSGDLIRLRLWRPATQPRQGRLRMDGRSTASG